MLRNYLTIALRNLRRQPGYTFINVAGLAVGLACCVLIVLFVRDELAYDAHHERADRIFRVTRPTSQGSHWAPVGPPVGPALQAAFPEVESFVRVFPIGGGTVLSVEGRDERFEAPGGVYVDSTVFEVFTLPLLRGDPARALTAPGSVVLSASMARRLFGEADPLGRRLGVTDTTYYTVTGVMADLPETTHLPFEYMVSMRTFADQEDWIGEARTWAGMYTYLLLRRPEDAQTLRGKLPAFVDTFFAPDYDEVPSTQTSLQLQPLTSIHLHSQLEKEYRPNSDVVYVYVFGMVALFVLVIASVNFINLTTARSGTRLREVGVRKVLGSTRTELARQFLAESLVMSGLALAVAYTLVRLGLPLLGSLTGKTFTAGDVHTPNILLAFAALTFATGLVSGLYPALYLSSFRPVRALRNDPTGRQPALLRRGLVVFQFALSIFMLAATLTVYLQLRYVNARALGFDKEQVVEVRISNYAGWRLRNDVSLDAFKQEMTRVPSVTRVSLASNAPGKRYSLENVRVEGEDEVIMVRIAWGVDHDYARTIGLTIVEGRDFSREAPTDTTAWLINESAARELGLTEPIGQVLRWSTDRYAGPIVGVVKDFHFASLHAPIEPLVIPLRPGIGSTLLIRVQGDIASALSHVENQLDELAPGRPFQYTFLDETFDQLYRAEKRLSQVFGLFAALAVMIACLGLFGLAAYTSERRRKEIGVRKVLGATVAHLVMLLSKEFAGLVVIAFALATPAAYFAMNRWLESFAYRVDLGAGVFALAGLLALAIALATVSYQAIKTALTDPVKSLRYE